MKITICGSIAFIDEMLVVQKELEGLGCEVKMPQIVGKSEKFLIIDDHQRKEEAMRNHFDKVMWADSVLILNYEKNSVPHYIGANTLLEMGLAFHHRKKIFLFNPVPDLSYREEILGMRPIVINQDLKQITSL